MSTGWENGILHMLGYFIDPGHPGLLEALDYLQRGRRDRVPKIVSKLNHHEVPVTVEEVNREARGGVPGRPHVANVLVQSGAVTSLQEAFDRYLKRGAPAFVEKVKLPPDQAIRVILDAGGVPVLAHPYSLRDSETHPLRQTVESLVAMGLQGIEVYYPEHTQEQTVTYRELAARYDLVITGGTDFHGANKPQVELGTISGFEPLPYEMVEQLRSRSSGTSLRCATWEFL
ncbi:MAG: phosphoesterase, partial [Deltaproteobacteria bacterium]|nr:phosphoesterase [Deltaproteobacteria bacterium]